MEDTMAKIDWRRVYKTGNVRNNKISSQAVYILENASDPNSKRKYRIAWQSWDTDNTWGYRGTLEAAIQYSQEVMKEINIRNNINGQIDTEQYLHA